MINYIEYDLSIYHVIIYKVLEGICRSNKHGLRSEILLFLIYYYNEIDLKYILDWINWASGQPGITDAHSEIAAIGWRPWTYLFNSYSVVGYEMNIFNPYSYKGPLILICNLLIDNYTHTNIKRIILLLTNIHTQI